MWTWDPSFQKCEWHKHVTGWPGLRMPTDLSNACERGRYQRERKWWGCPLRDKHSVYQEMFHCSESSLTAELAPRGSLLGGCPNYCMGLHKLHGKTRWITILLKMFAMMALHKPTRTCMNARATKSHSEGGQKGAVQHHNPPSPALCQTCPCTSPKTFTTNRLSHKKIKSQSLIANRSSHKPPRKAG